jgi:AcrR family transcriptional regulator
VTAVSSTQLAPGGSSRRTRKKIRTREALAEAAIELFSQVGYQETTVEAIADMVDVSRRTFHRYFPCKEDVLFADAADRLALFRAALEQRPSDEPVLAAVRAAVRELAQDLAARPDIERTRLQLIESTPSLLAQHLRYQDELAAAVTEYAAERAEPGTDPAWPAMLGACTVAVVRAMRRRWMAAEVEGTLADALDHGFDILTHLTQPMKGSTQ